MQSKLTSRQKQAMETKQRIKSAAIKLFEERGFDNVYIEDIAAEAGCSVGNIYHYFKNKEELSMHMTEHVDAEYEKLAAAYRADGEHSALWKLLDFVGQSLRISSEETVLYASIIYGIKVDPADMVDRLVTIHRGTLVNWRLCQEEFDLIEMGRKIAGDMIRGLGS